MSPFKDSRIQSNVDQNLKESGNDHIKKLLKLLKKNFMFPY